MKLNLLASINRKILIFFIPLLFLSIFITGLILEELAIKSARYISKTEIMHFNKFFANTIIRNYTMDDWRGLKSLIDSVAKFDKQITSITIFDLKGTIIADLDIEKIDNKIKDKDIIKRVNKGENEFKFMEYKDGTIGIQSITSIKMEKGFVKGGKILKKKLPKLTELNSRIFSMTIIIILTILIITTFLTFLFARILTKPLTSLIILAKNISEGDIQQKELKITSNDEIGSLTTIFNKMILLLNQLVNQAKDIAAGKLESEFVEKELAKGQDFEAAAAVATSDQMKGDLADSFNNMIKELRKLTVQARTIAKDDLTNPLLDVKIPGELGESFSQMVIKLRNFAKQAQSIANGDLKNSLLEKTSKGDLGRAFGEMIKSLQLLAQQAKAIANGELSSSILKQEVKGDLGTAFGEMVRSLKLFSNQIDTVEKGDYKAEILKQITSGELGNSLNNMTRTLKQVTKENKKQIWLAEGRSGISFVMRGEPDKLSLGNNISEYLAEYLQTQIVALYVFENDNKLHLSGSYIFNKQKSLTDVFASEGGLIYQAASGNKSILISDIQDDCLTINSSIADITPKHIIAVPFSYEGNVKGVVELGSFKEFSNQKIEFLESIMQSIAITFISAKNRVQMKELLEETQAQSEELQSQQEELKTTNEDLEKQTQQLQTSEEELQASNEELQEKSHYLEKQKEEIENKNQELEITRQEIEEKARELALASKYKSEFLANMSHELRTPLNSLLLLSASLSGNNDKNLTTKQLEHISIINNSGKDLLQLINEILDLSKIEAGHLNIEIREVLINDLANSINFNFKHMTTDKNLELKINIDPNLPFTILTDKQRLEQIIKNLLSNAIKFTQFGSVIINFKHPEKNINLSRIDLNIKNAIAIAVTDTGIGIPIQQQQVISEAFQQAEGGTTRKYGGTGLGLSISRELAKLLVGEIQLISEQGKGSTFTVYLPLKGMTIPEKDIKNNTPILKPQPAAKTSVNISELKQKTLDSPHIPDDGDSLEAGEKSILIIEDDPNFAKILVDQCHDMGSKCLTAASGEEGLQLAEQYPLKGIILDLKLPGIDGITVLDALKSNPKTRHIPVHMMSAQEEIIDVYKKGAIGFLKKPVNKKQLKDAFKKLDGIEQKEIKDLLLVEDNENQRKAILAIIGNDDVKVKEAGNSKEAILALKSNKYDCMILDIGLPDMNGFDLLSKLTEEQEIIIPPIIIYTGRELSNKEEEQLRKYSSTIIIKGAKSEERLLDETALFLHRVVDNMPQNKRKIITNLHNRDNLFKDKKILIVDDDMRNVYAISNILREKRFKVFEAGQGQDGLDILLKEPDMDLVITDIMMPVMDGYEVIKKIRSQKQFYKLPIIALTAKAMQDDREKCLSVGATDYLSKPVDLIRLFSMLRVWLYN